MSIAALVADVSCFSEREHAKAVIWTVGPMWAIGLPSEVTLRHVSPRPSLSPPRPLAPGDVVVAFSDSLGEWTAAQVTHVDLGWGDGRAGVLELDWSGPEPQSLADLGELQALRLTHHSHTGGLSHCNFEWLLPRGYKVLGNAPLLHDRASDSYSVGWRLGEQLAAQRRWDSGERTDIRPGEYSYSAGDLAARDKSAGPLPDAWRVTISKIDSLDCAELVALCPNVTQLRLHGNLGALENAGALRELVGLRSLFVTDLFGMTRSDCITIGDTPRLAMLGLHSVPSEYAAAMKKAWAPEVVNGTCLEIRSPRKPEWVAENRTNPLRDWDGRDHISAVRFRKSVRQFKATRRAVLDVLAAASEDDYTTRLTEIGCDFGEAFNALDGTRSPFIETEEREELFAALEAIVASAEEEHGRPFQAALDHLCKAVERVRTW